MKKRRVSRPLLILAVTIAMIAATAVVASAATINKDGTNFQKATKMMITTYPDKILFNADRLTRDQHGEYTNVFVKGHNFDAMLKNGWGEWMATKAPSTMKPGKKYDLYAGQIDRVNNYQVNSKVYKLATVTMGPSTKPVINSVKISNVKVKRYFSYNERKYRYKTTFKMTVTLSKKAMGAKGIDLTTSVNGISSYKTLKGTKNTYTANFNWDMPMSLKGKTVSVKVKTYNDTKYKAYSYDSKAKKAKI